MKTLLLCILSVAASIAWAAEPSATVKGASGTNAHSQLVRSGYLYVEASPEQRTNLDVALTMVRLERKMTNSCETVEEAAELLWRSVHLVADGGTRACTEYRGFFWFSRRDRGFRLDHRNGDDRTFKSGLAVKKGTGEIYHWDMEAQQAGAANRSQPVRPETNQPSAAAGSAR